MTGVRTHYFRRENPRLAVESAALRSAVLETKKNALSAQHVGEKILFAQKSSRHERGQHAS